MKRNSKMSAQSYKLQTERDKRFAERQNKILETVLDIQKTVLRLASQLDMRKKIAINDYFPIKSDADLQQFLDKSDGFYKARREEFENFLYCSVTNAMKLKRPFESNLLATFFSRDYIKSHKWPGPG